MTDTADIPDPTQLDGAPHPRETARLLGQGQAEAGFLDAFATGRLHHGWLLTGPRGVGKATLAWRIARFLLATPLEQEDGLFGAPPPPNSLDIDPDHPVARRIRARSEPGVFLLRRFGKGPDSNPDLRLQNFQKGDFSSEIRVPEVREMARFLHRSAADGGRRVVIVDDADALNTNAANALLKLLEEPPADTVMLLISHQPAGLLPTIRSRCRTLRLASLSAEDMAAALEQAGAQIPVEETTALSALSGGSVGSAFQLHEAGGLALYADLVSLLGSLPRLDRPRLLALAESCAGRGKEARLDLVLSLTDLLAARLARSGVIGAPPEHEAVRGESEVLRRLAPDPATGRRWAEAVQVAGDRARHARAVNVDSAALVTDLFLTLSRAV
ncbi:DNA polymerase III subunit delta' [Thalassococcus sp. CAU 1522]|uniref:DNA polymerase III subunit delta n=1 Tax=Thalassococcus arenae TaxID=2851652 RepID=A0ABS6N2E1_9RHOB|nr:DNA polymerase III subunit delta' [Thalassococcus arenae]